MTAGKAGTGIGGKGKSHFMPGRSRRRENIRRQKKKFPRIVEEIVRTSDIILQVLDARFIQETRNKELEEIIEKQGKKLIHVLNKSDLVDTAKKQKEIPKNMGVYVFVSSRSRKGIRMLREKIKIAVRRTDMQGKDRAQVGIIGYPNTGKSSLINTLTGRGSAKTGAQAGFTRGLQKISLSKGIMILDTPGVIPESKYSHTKTQAIQEQAKLGARTLDTIRDPELVVQGLLDDYAEQIGDYYGVKLTNEGEVETALQEIAERKKLLKKGGLADEDRVARLIIKDWQEGKIRI